MAQPSVVGQQLAGYVVTQEPAVADLPKAQAKYRAQLRTAPRERLPEYAVSSHLSFLARILLMSNDGLDRKSLPQPDASLLQQVYMAPRSDLEQQVVGIWAEVLQSQQVGFDDSLFEPGGRPLLAIQVTARMQSEVGVELPLAALSQIESLQACVELAAAQTSSNDTDFDNLRELMNELEVI